MTYEDWKKRQRDLHLCPECDGTGWIGDALVGEKEELCIFCNGQGDLQCEVDDCTEWAFPVGHGLIPEHRYCPKHAHERGWCYRCGGFFGGIESFEFEGICDDCQFAQEEIEASENELYYSEGEWFVWDGSEL